MRDIGRACAAFVVRERSESYRLGRCYVGSRGDGGFEPTVSKGLKEIEAGVEDLGGGIRKKGGGRKQITDKEPELLNALNLLIEPATRGDPENPLRWTSKSTIELAEALKEQGFQVTQRTVHRLLVMQKYSLKANRKTKEGAKENPDRDEQFQYINGKVKEFQEKKCPALSVDTKKKENIGEFKNNGKEWSPKGKYTDVNVHDFIDKEKGKAAPYGVYDVTNNKGWVSVGISSDTAEFAVNSIDTWYNVMGNKNYSEAKEILIMADSGGSNASRSRLWKYELQRLANKLNKSITVCHFPPGTSKWNKIEHRMFSQISKNWRGVPLVDLQTIVELIGNTTTKTGLKIQTEIDKNTYETGRKISDAEFAKINITRHEFHGEWNYAIHPQI